MQRSPAAHHAPHTLPPPLPRHAPLAQEKKTAVDEAMEIKKRKRLERDPLHQGLIVQVRAPNPTPSPYPLPAQPSPASEAELPVAARRPTGLRWACAGPAGPARPCHPPPPRPAPPCPAPPLFLLPSFLSCSQRANLKPRDFQVDLAAKLHKTQVRRRCRRQRGASQGAPPPLPTRPRLPTFPYCKKKCR